MEEKIKEALDKAQREKERFSSKDAAYYFSMGYREGYADGSRSGVTFAEELLRNLLRKTS